MEAVIFQKPADIDVETIADDFQIDTPAETVIVEFPEEGVDEGSLQDEALHLLGCPLEHPGYLPIGFSGSDLSLPVLPVDLLPVPPGEGAQQLVAHIPHADGTVEIAEDEVSHDCLPIALHCFGRIPFWLSGPSKWAGEIEAEPRTRLIWRGGV